MTIMEPIKIRNAALDDSEAIVNIYNPYILNTVITFEEEAITSAEIERRMANVQSLGLPYLVAEENGKVIGYAYASQWRTRIAYRYTVESTIYLDPTCTGKGIGTRLYQALLDELKQRGMHIVIGGITVPNPASQALHEKLGFTKIAHFSEVGYKFNQWLDTGFWQLTL